MHPNFTIRSATLTDLPTLLDLIHLKAAFDGCPDSVCATLESLDRDLFGTEPLAAVLLVEIEGEAIGFASYYPIYSTFLAKPGLWMDDLYLKADFRQQGIGTALMRQLCQIAEEMGCGRVDWTVAVDNAPGIQFYQHIGAQVMLEVHQCRLNQGAITQLARQQHLS